MAGIIDIIKEYLNVTAEQVFHIIDYLVRSKLVVFEDGKLVITLEGYSSLSYAKLSNITIESMSEIKYIVNEASLENYIPKKL